MNDALGVALPRSGSIDIEVGIPRAVISRGIRGRRRRHRRPTHRFRSKLAPSERRKLATPAMSAAVPLRRSGVCSSSTFMRGCCSSSRCPIGASIMPGEIEQTRPTSGPSATASPYESLDAPLGPSVGVCWICARGAERREVTVGEICGERRVDRSVGLGVGADGQMGGHRRHAHDRGTGRNERTQRGEDPRGADEVDVENAPPVGHGGGDACGVHDATQRSFRLHARAEGFQGCSIGDIEYHLLAACPVVGEPAGRGLERGFVSQLGITLVALLQHPQWLERVRHDRSLLRAVVEESVRWTPTDPVSRGSCAGTRRCAVSTCRRAR